LEAPTYPAPTASSSPDGTRIASGSIDKTVRLWDAATRQSLGEPLEGHTEEVSSISFSPDGTRIASGSADKTVRLWDAATGQPLGEPLEGHTEGVWSVSFSPDGTRIASGSWDMTVRLWDAATGQSLGEPLEGHTEAVQSVSFSPDGARIASGSIDKTVRLWDAAMAQPSVISRDPDSFAFSLHLSTAPPAQERCIMSTSTSHDHLISFSSSLAHALPNSADLFEPTSHHNSNSTPFLLQADGWMMGPNHRLLFWVPPASRHAFYTPCTSLVIPRGYPELDLSHMAHGTHWSSCRDASM
jgi:WD40 repeat protein